jgi:hypothetical protein
MYQIITRFASLEAFLLSLKSLWILSLFDEIVSVIKTCD